MGKTNNDEIEALKAQLEAEREELEALRQKLIEDANELNEARKEITEKAAKLEAEKTAMEEKSSLQAVVEGLEEPVEMVTVKLHKDKNVKNDVFVCVNGKTYQIQRGVEVQVPKFVKEVLDNTERMDELAIKRQEEAAKSFAEAAKNLK